MARLRGFEPPTPSSGGWCSDPLSYRRAFPRRGPGRGEWIRTTDPLLPKQMRYQAALRPEVPRRSAYLTTLRDLDSLGERTTGEDFALAWRRVETDMQRCWGPPPCGRAREGPAHDGCGCPTGLA